MGLEEQTEEREVLESIFPDELTGTILSQSSCPLTHCRDI